MPPLSPSSMTRPFNNTTESLRVWQWNCRGYKQKRSTLQMHSQTLEKPPEIIALQETGTNVKLPGYKAFQSSHDPKTAVLIQRNIPAERLEFESINIPHDFVVLYPTKRSATRVYILNVYSNPKAHSHNFNLLFSLAKKESQKHMLLIVGDFNAPHTAWGYSHCTKKGRLLWDQVQAHRLTLETDPLVPTRVGNSVQRIPLLTSPSLITSPMLIGTARTIRLVVIIISFRLSSLSLSV